VYSPVAPRSLLGGIAAACSSHGAAIENEIEVLRTRYGALDALLTDSGTSALILALRAIVPPGGTIAYPGYSCIDLTSAAVGAGVRVRLYDLDPNTLSPDLESVKKAIHRGVNAIVVAHLYGYPADVGAVQELARQHGIPVIEDSAQGAGGTLRGIRLGGIGDISILSFGRGKGATTGSGGAILVRTPALSAWVRQIRNELGVGRRGGREIGALTAQWLLSHPLLYRFPALVPALKLGEMVYHPPKQPRAMPTAAAAMLCPVLRMDDSEIEIRRQRANTLSSRINRSGRIVPIRPVGDGSSGFLRLAVTDMIGDLAARAPLGVLRGYTLTLEQHEQLQPMLAPGERAGKGSVQLRDRLFTLPTHSRVGSRDQARLENWLAASS
jgi:dTDP-4-amino-4,6-dideoxygalactose transaminase